MASYGGGDRGSGDGGSAVVELAPVYEADK